MLKQNRFWKRWALACLAGCIAVLIWQGVGAQQPEMVHPLSPLTVTEIETAVAIVKKEKSLGPDVAFPDISLREPDKETVLNFVLGSPISRQVNITTIQRRKNVAYDAVIDLNKKKLVSWSEISTGQPPILDDEYVLLDKLAKSDPRWQEAVKKRGINDFENTIVDGWAMGMMNEKEKADGKRLMRGITYYKGKDRDNYYGAPIEGLMVTVDLNGGKVFEVIDNGIVPFSKENFDYDEKTLAPLQKSPSPLRIKQPKGNSFVINGNEVSWLNWKFRYLMHPREGLTLYQISYNDNGKERPILYRASLSEMVVPYSDTSRAWAVRSAFDVGEYRFGWLSTPLEPNNDVPENALLLDALFADESGKPSVTKNIIGIYEQDSGILWRHYDFNTETFEGRRARNLVITTVAAIGNYDYAINWIFHQDGTLEQKSELTGIMLAKATPDVSQSHHGLGTLVAPNVEAINHQHMMNFRLDFDVDGKANSIREMKVATVEKSANPYGNAFVMLETPLEDEKSAVRDVKASESRSWAVINPGKKNAVGATVGYMLMPGDNTPYYPNEFADSRQKGEFATHHLWTTRYNPSELYAAGNYPNQASSPQGLPRYIADNQSLDNHDLVVWYTYGVTHTPRPEEWPIMTVHPAGFKIMSWGFFDRNPVLNVPKNRLHD
ncbi:MAG: Copper methylamine oxidase [Chroococcopsis gigantea SAG 12.99]|nr:primary-amine oxidase [Chlorogloea purpurea SAG 13.99]MDV3000523.1 Copper methylamine oxidase [Chroococcopsis gigantea SAG 12.99]